MPEQKEIQLLSESRRKLDIKVPGENKPLSWGGIILLLAVGIYFGLQYYVSTIRTKLQEIDDQIVTVEREREKKFEQELLVLHKQLTLAGSLMRSHLIWSNVLIKLQELTPAAAQLTLLGANVSDNRVEFKALAPSYTVIARHVANILADSAFSDVDLNKVSNTSTGLLEYDLRVTFNRSKILFNNASASGQEGTESPQ